MDYFLFMGLGLGLSAGFAPGPLTTLIITESLQHGPANGLKVAMAPFVTDTPIILCSFYLLSSLASSNNILAIISFTGAAFLLYLGVLNLRQTKLVIATETTASRSLFKGVMANFLSPNPYLFWVSVGGPILHQATFLQGAAFLASFYLVLISIKMAMALVVGRSRHFLSGTLYGWIMRLMGGLLCLLSVVLLRDGVRLLTG